MAETVKWEMVRGDTLGFVVTIQDAESVAQTPSAMAFSCRTEADAPDYIFSKTIGDGITLVETGKYRVRVAPEDTEDINPGTYAIDLQITVGSDVVTPILGKLKIKQDVTWGE